jgi:hypothetical protein
LRRYSNSMLRSYASGVRNRSTCTEWSITRSTGIDGSIESGSTPARWAALRIAARSTTAGTPVKSCINTRAGMKAMSPAGSGQAASARTSSSETSRVPARRRMFSNRISTVFERFKRSPPVFEARVSSRNRSIGPSAVSNRPRAPASSLVIVRVSPSAVEVSFHPPTRAPSHGCRPASVGPASVGQEVVVDFREGLIEAVKGRLQIVVRR